ncbi:MAG: HmuY family protein [Nitrospina sp.]|nr:HmuY family protein [Nitrospina sp.]
MNNGLKVIGMLLGATLFFNVAMNYMGDNITEFENRPLPPKKVKVIRTNNPILKVNATSRDNWTLVDFSEKKSHQVGDIDSHPEQLSQHDWDLGFQRTKVITNSGATHKGGVGVADLGPVKMDSVKTVSDPGFVEDTREWGSLRNDAISGWYNYRTRTHNVESRKSVYLVRTSEGGHVKLRILNYYCNHSESECKTGICTREEAACLTLEYVYIPPGETQFPESKKTRTASLKSKNGDGLN